MYPTHNPQSTKTTNLSSKQSATSLSNHLYSQNNNFQQLSSLQLKSEQKTSLMNTNSCSQSTSRSVAKFKRTNPLMQSKQERPNDVKHKQPLNSDKELSLSKQRKKNHYYHANQYTQRSTTFGSEHHQSNIPTPLTTERQINNFIPHPQSQNRLPSSSKYMTQRNQRNALTLNKNSYFNIDNNDDLRSIKSFKSTSKSKIGADQENYSLYWKNKAHQYLQRNFKLSQEVTELKRQLAKCQNRQTQVNHIKENIENNKIKENKNNNSQHNSIPLHIAQLQQRRYISQITQLQKTNLLKDSIIQNLQTKIIQLTNQVKGQNQKSLLLQKLRIQVQQLMIRNNETFREQDERKLQVRKQKCNRAQNQKRRDQYYEDEEIAQEWRKRRSSKYKKNE